MPLQPPIDELLMSNTVPSTEIVPANQVTFPLGWRKKSQAITAASRPFNEGKKAVLVAVVYFNAIAMVNRARHSKLPSITPRLITALLMSFRVIIRIQIPTGKSVTISQNEKIIGSMRPNASFETE